MIIEKLYFYEKGNVEFKDKRYRNFSNEIREPKFLSLSYYHYENDFETIFKD